MNTHTHTHTQSQYVFVLKQLDSLLSRQGVCVCLGWERGMEGWGKVEGVKERERNRDKEREREYVEFVFYIFVHTSIH